MSSFRSLAAIVLSAAIGLTVLSSGTPAAQGRPANPAFRRGVSIGHWLADMNAGQAYGAPWFGRDDVVWIGRQGFDHLRIPVDGRLWVQPDGSLDESRIAVFEQAVGWAKDAGLSTVLDLVFLPVGRSDDARQDPVVFSDAPARAAAAKFWQDVARRFASAGPWLRFELIDQPMAPSAADLNAFNAAAVASIREADPARVVYITSNSGSTFATLPDVVMPNDPNVALLLRYDEPLIFTHQRVSSRQFPSDMPLINFPGVVPDLTTVLPPEHFAYKASNTLLTAGQIEGDFVKASAWVASHIPGRTVYIGGFGVYASAPAASRRTYIATVRAASERRGWGWAVWDYKSSFGIRGRDNRPTAVLDGLFDK